MFKKLSLDKTLYLILVGLLAYMPFHLFISRWLSLYTGYLGQWDSAKDFVTLFGLGVSLILAWRHKLYRNRIVLLVFGISLLYALLHLSYYLFVRENLDGRPFVVATLFNGRFFAYLFMGIIAAAIREISWLRILKITIVISTVTCLFGLVQYFGPKDLMTHFGYSIARGALPAFFIDAKPDFPRIMSTVRDPNSYGAYLIVPLVILFVWLVRREAQLRKLVPLFVLHLLAIFLTFSRGAWIGAIIALGFAAAYILRQHLIRLTKKYAYVLVIMAIIATGILYMYRDSYVVQNVFLHSDKSTVMADPNELRVELQKTAIEGIVNDPEGHGPGTAGIVSIGNTRTGVVLTENYFLQIAYEIGIVGLLLYLSLLVIAAKGVLHSKNTDMKIILISSFAAYMFISLLIHLWSNEAVAAQWWILAGLLIGEAAHRDES